MKTEDVNRFINQRQALNETPPCKTHPDAPHGFDRNASHSADRYVCECESWESDVDNSAHEAENVHGNVDDINMSEKRVHKSDKSIHEPVAWMLHGELFWPSEYEVISEAGDNAIPLYTALPQKEWIGLTDEEIRYVWDHSFSIWGVARLMEAKLKEKNT